MVFVERGLGLLQTSGHLAYILPHKFFNAKYGRPLRTIISNGKHLRLVVHFGDRQVFPGATNYVCLLFLAKAGADKLNFERADDLDEWNNSSKATRGSIPAKSITGDEWNFGVGAGPALQEKLRAMPTKLRDVTARIFQGLVTGADGVFSVPSTISIESGLTHPQLLTGGLAPYGHPTPSARLIFPYDIKGGKASLIPAGEMKERYPEGWAYLSQNRDKLASRERGKWRHAQWYAYARSQNLTQMDAPKLIIQVTTQKPTVLLDKHGLYMTGGGSGPFYGVRPRANSIPMEFLLGVLNSSVFGWLVRQQSTLLRGGYIKFSKQYIESTPTPDSANLRDRDVAGVVSLVQTMLKLYKNLPKAKTPPERECIQRQIAATDEEIDRLVYDLYGLTEDEIAIVEGRVK